MAIGNDCIFTVSYEEAQNIHSAGGTGVPIVLSESTQTLLGECVNKLLSYLEDQYKQGDISFEDIFYPYRGQNDHYLVPGANITL